MQHVIHMNNNISVLLLPCRVHEPSLFTGLQVQFYYVPLSQASTATEASLNSASQHQKPLDSANHLIQPLVDGAQPSWYGEDVWLSCYIGNMDSWYERNVLLATHNILRIIPSVSIDNRYVGAVWQLLRIIFCV